MNTLRAYTNLDRAVEMAYVEQRRASPATLVGVEHCPSLAPHEYRVVAFDLGDPRDAERTGPAGSYRVPESAPGRGDSARRIMWARPFRAQRKAA